jgi:hypothetical protein
LEASTETKVLKNVVNKKPRKNSTEIISVWTSLEGKKTEPKLIGLNRFSVRFGSKTKKKIKSVWLFILVQNRTGPKMLSPSVHIFFKEKNVSFTRFAFHSKNSQINYTMKYL